MTDALIAFVGSTNLERSRSFYAEKLGLAFVDVNPYALVLLSGDVMVRVTAVSELTPQPFTVLGWRVDNIVARMAELDLAFARYEGIGQDENGVWTAPGGDQVAWFHDPDGNLLSLTQFA